MAAVSASASGSGPPLPLRITALALLLNLFSSCRLVKGDNGDGNGNDLSRGLFPPTFNLASDAIITANATCGQEGPETFCKLVEHVSREPQCGVCDSRSAEAAKRHPIANAIDGSNNWWQSPSLQNGRQYEWVTITLDLRQVYQVAYVIVKAANSPRPGNWVLERSLDGIDYKPWQYYAILDAECLELYGVAPTVGIPRYISDQEVICTSFFSKLNPIENGEIHTSLVNGRPGVVGPSDRLQEFTSARYVRLRLQKVRTLNADLMSVSNRNWDLVDKSVTRRRGFPADRLFYSVKDISIGGQCMCFGHAADCPRDPVTKRLKCRCVHDTCGDSCEKCCPLYNQKRWRVGTSADASTCEKCQCFGHADECRYDEGVAARRESLDLKGRYEGGGVCLNCREFTAGNNCELCAEGFYRPVGVTRHDPHPCRKCLCDGAGATGRCVQDEALPGSRAGDCLCRDGFAGLRCDACARGHRNYPICDPCPCDFAGTVNTACDGECVCKANVDGLRCDRCKPGFFNLDAEDPDGCTRCFCFGVTQKCESAALGVEVISPKKAWKVSSLNGEKVLKPTLERGLHTVANDDMIGYDTYYWSAPKQLVGNKLNSYGGRLRANVSWVTPRGDSAGKPTTHADVVLKGGGRSIAYGDAAYGGTDNVLLDVTLAEPGWYLLGSDGEGRAPVGRREFMEVLLSIDTMLVRAKYHTDQLVARLHTVAVEVGSSATAGINTMRNVEKCLCPPGYAGLSCEGCEKGYRRVNGTVYGGQCRRCDCNGHADECDAFTGRCAACLHNTTGERCETCLPGFYGAAAAGSPGDCRPCACPLLHPANNFSPVCETGLGPDGAVDYVCTRCPAGYEGPKCDRCADGFFGNPLVAGDSCRPCDCSGNVDATASGNCDRVTGQCLKCVGNTAGPKCDSCARGFYGQAETGSCRACDCSVHGSLSPLCDPRDGNCRCRPRFVGRDCDRCEENYGNIAAGCERCDCDAKGSASLACDPVSGLCECKPGVFGARCASCVEGYYDFSQTGCSWCGCDERGSRDGACDPRTGQCPCWPSVRGRSCDTCKVGFWNLTSSVGCETCDCDGVGSSETVCDPGSGACNCKPGVGGRTCSECLPEYFGFSAAGCKQCAACDSPGHVCHPHTGDCVCPPYTEGAVCERCRANTWGYDPYKGCKPCECSSEGSAGAQCDPANGQCACAEGYEGARCDACLFAYFDFPKCKKCRCHADGSLPRSCRADGQCECAPDGQCRCRENASGKKCRRCKPGTFGLTSQNPKGCFRCDCFGKSDECAQAEYSWSQTVLLDTLRVSAYSGETALNASNGARVFPASKGDATIGVRFPLEAPVYWVLPDVIKGDRVLSYNGRLSFTVEVEGGLPFPDSLLRTHPLVQLQGNFRVVLAHHVDSPSPDGRYEVRLHEDLWKMKNNPESPVTRRTMMVALQNVQRVLVRATDGSHFDAATIRDVRLDVAVPATPFSPVVAVGVEICRCPRNYVGTSCQDPAAGYYRYRKKDFLNSKDILDLVGAAVPCPCNNRSNVCDRETGICRHCRENTSGLYCEICSIGYYGRPDVAPCTPCACPTVNESYSDSCEMDTLGGFVCTNCVKGYAGQFCERCAKGHYGDPLSSRGCVPCACSAKGSAGPDCHPASGQCACLPGVTGRDCSVCPPRHALADRRCQPCDDNCTGLLLDDLERSKGLLSAVNFTGVTPAPWTRLLNLEQRAARLKERVDAYGADLETGERLIVDFETTFNLQGQADLLYLKSVDGARNSSAVLKNATAARARADTFLKDALALGSDIDEIAEGLAGHAAGLNNASTNFGAALDEAEKILAEIRARSFIPALTKSEIEFGKATALLHLVRQLSFDAAMLVDLEKRLAAVKGGANDIVQQLTKVRATSHDANLLNAANDRKKLDLVSKRAEVSRILGERENRTLEAAGDLNDAKEWIDKAGVDLQALGELSETCVNLTVRLDAFVNHASRTNALYEKIHVRPAEEHAQDLTRRAVSYSEKFNSTREVSESAMRALSSYDEARLAVVEAREAAENASLAAREAYSRTHRDGEAYLVREASRLRESGEDLLLPAAKGLRDRRVPELRSLSERVDLERLVRQNEKVEAELESLRADMESVRPGDVSSDLADAAETAERASAISAEASAVAGRTEGGVRENLRPRLKALLSATDAGLDDVHKSAEDALNGSRAINDRLHKLENKQNAFVGMVDEMRQKVLHFNGKMKQLKQTAWAIREVSLRGDEKGTCRRSIRVDARPSVTSSIVLKYAIGNDVNSSILFLAGTGNKPDFMAVEMVDRRIRFAWNAGDKTDTVVEHGLRLRQNDDLQSMDERWYKIEITRVGNNGILTVRSASDSSRADPRKATGASKPGFSRLDLDNGTRCHIGGYPENFKVPSVLKSGGRFSGCLYQVVLDEDRVGLWDFETNRGCAGCKTGVDEAGADGAVRFNGNGYAVVGGQPSRRNDSYHIILKFRTFDEDALLLFIPNGDTKDHLLLELKGGRVAFQFGCGGRPPTRITTTDTYNNGSEVLVDAHYKNYTIGQLIVNRAEPLQAASDIKGSEVIDVKGRDVYVAGVPPSFPREQWESVSFAPFAGCVPYVQLMNRFVNFASAKQTYGMEPSCAEVSLTTVAFSGDGYLELPARPLPKGGPSSADTGFGFSFQTHRPHALLAFSRFDGGIYYSAALSKGRLEVWVGNATANAVRTLASHSAYDDGRVHNMLLTRKDRELQLFVDDEQVNATKMAKALNVDFVRSGEGGLFFGGVREDVNVTGKVASSAPLFGIVRDAVFNNKILNFAETVGFRHATVGYGRNRTASAFAGRRREAPNGTAACVEVVQYTVESRAVKFGDAPRSFVQLPATRNNFRKEFNLTFGLRTFYPNGLVLFAAGAQRKKKHYFAVYLSGGHVHVVVRGKRKFELKSGATVNDGRWQRVRLVKAKRNLKLTVRDNVSRSARVPKQLNISPPVFVGGLQQAHQLPDDGEPFKGCIRNLELNGKLIDLAGGKVSNVGQCFTDIVAGSYFAGDAYATYATEFEVGVKMDVELSFRTTKLNGILLSVSEPSGSPALSLEIHGGNVTLSADSGDGRASRVTSAFESRFYACDNEWHVVKASYSAKNLSLKVDGSPAWYGTFNGPDFRPVATRSPLYVGGLPDSAADGVLESRANFVGCIRKVVINEKTLDWTDMARRENVQLDSCAR